MMTTTTTGGGSTSTLDSKAAKGSYFASLASTNSSLNKLNNVSLNDDIKLKIYYAGLITVIYLKYEDQSGHSFVTVDLARFQASIRSVCKFDAAQPFTVKWVDEEGDPCTLSSQMELDGSCIFFLLSEADRLNEAFSLLRLFSGEFEPFVSVRSSLVICFRILFFTLL